MKLQHFAHVMNPLQYTANLSAVKFIQELQISVETATVEVCQTFSPLGIIVTISKANSEISIICSRSFVYLGKEKYPEMLVLLALTKPLMFKLQEMKSKHFLSVVAVPMVQLQFRLKPFQSHPYNLLLVSQVILLPNFLKFQELLLGALSNAFSCNGFDEVATLKSTYFKVSHINP